VFLLAENGRALLMVRGAPVLMVRPDPGVVERELVAGGLACPACGGELRLDFPPEAGHLG
jgi:hypothetical protein